MNKDQKSEKLGVVYTCITKGYDDLYNHSYLDSCWDYVCFTDNLLIKNSKNSSWQIRPLVFKDLDPVRNQRWHKLHPHLLFPEYKRSLWIDGNVDVLKKDLFDDIKKAIDESRLISIAPHRDRNCIYEELQACIELAKDDPEIMKKQIDQLRQYGFPGKKGFFESNIMFREHNDIKVIEIMNDWWSWIENFSKRDQLSFTYVLWKHGFKVLPLTDVSYRRNDGRIALRDHNKVLLRLLEQLFRGKFLIAVRAVVGFVKQQIFLMAKNL